MRTFSVCLDQGCRTNKGLIGPGNYYYEVVVLENGDIRLGWSTNDANIILGADEKGYGYGADDSGSFAVCTNKRTKIRSAEFFS